MSEQKTIPWDVVIEILNKFQANNPGLASQRVNKYVNDEIYEWFNENQLPYVGRSEVNHLMTLAEEAGGGRIHENIVQMTEQDLERFIYLYGKGYQL